MAARRLRRLLCDEVDPYPSGEDVRPVALTGRIRRFITRQEATMRLREKGKKDGEVISMGWDEAQEALRAGTHEVADAAGSGSESGRANGEGDGNQGGEAGDDFDGKTRPELEQIAAERGVDVSGARTKGDVIEALRAAR